MEKYILAFALGFLLLGCTGTQSNGHLKGTVTIGPLCPVEPCHLTPGEIAKVYTSRSAIVYAADMRTVIAQENLSANGTYSFSLAPGKYFISISPAGIAPFEPKEVEVSANQATTLNIAIDTGIR